ncbi:MAG: branched-chain amino acid transaminase [Deltaproteobacteria bacterium]|nr:branched-chain amino acid transaminase [Deltaproteobacteria bacterium]
MLKKASKIWQDGKLVPWDQANVHVLTHTLHYGLGVFEGIRFYEGINGKSAVFRLKGHIQRLFDSAHIFNMKIPFGKEEIVEACKETIRINNLKKGYIRPIVFLGDGEMGLYATSNPVRVSIATWEWGSYLGDEGIKNGIRAKISSFIKPPVNAAMNKAKACGNYINSILAKREAIQAGYEEAILLDIDGFVAEASGENIFMVKNGLAKTTPLGSPILQGITRDSIITLLGDSGISISEERFSRDELYLADEVFLTGTAAEITPIREVDNRVIGSGKPGAVTRQAQELFFSAVRGENSKYHSWLDGV